MSIGRRHDSRLGLDLLARHALEWQLQPLIEIMLTSPRDFTVAVKALFHGVMRAAVGRSLHQENADLFNEVNALFEARNRLAHRGELPTEEVARRAVAAAVGAFEWLDSLEASPTDEAAAST